MGKLAWRPRVSSIFSTGGVSVKGAGLASTSQTASASSPTMVCGGGEEACPPRLSASRDEAQLALLRRAHQGAGLRHAREGPGDHRPALVEHQRGAHAALGERRDDVPGGGPGGLLLAGEGEVDVVGGHEALAL